MNQLRTTPKYWPVYLPGSQRQRKREGKAVRSATVRRPVGVPAEMVVSPLHSHKRNTYSSTRKGGWMCYAGAFPSGSGGPRFSPLVADQPLPESSLHRTLDSQWNPDLRGPSSALLE